MAEQELKIGIDDQSVDKAVSKLSKAVEAISGGVGGLLGGQHTGGSFLGQAGGAAGMAIGGPLGSAIGSAIGPALEKAAPGAMAHLSMIFDDISASFGQVFTPILTALGPALRDVGDVVATLAAPLGEIVQALMEPLGEWWKILGSLLKDLASVISSVLGATLVPLLKVWAKVLQIALIPLRAFADLIHSLVGTSAAKSSVGASAQRASFTSFESFGQSLQTAAYSEGAKGMSSVPSTVGEIRDLLKYLSDFITHPADKAREAVTELAPAASDRAAKWRERSTVGGLERIFGSGARGLDDLFGGMAAAAGLT